MSWTRTSGEDPDFSGFVVEPLAGQAIEEDDGAWCREAVIAQAYLMVLEVSRDAQRFVVQNCELREKLRVLGHPYPHPVTGVIAE